MDYENYILDALEMVMAWDLPDEEFADAVNDQARLMAGINPEEIIRLGKYKETLPGRIEDISQALNAIREAAESTTVVGILKR